MPNDLDPNILFENREDAAKHLMMTMPANRFDPNDTIVIGVSEGGVYLAEYLSSRLRVGMDILLTEPIFAPNNPELEIAIVSETEEIVMHHALIDSFGIDEDYIYSEANRKYEETVLSYVYKYRKGIPLESLKNKQVILTDECIDTGLTMMVALKSMIMMGVRSVYVAVPVLDQLVHQGLLALCDGIFCPHQIQDYISVEYYYRDLEKLDFETLEEIIERNGVTNLEKHKKMYAEKNTENNTEKELQIL